MRWQRCIFAEKPPKNKGASGHRNGAADAPFEALGPPWSPPRSFAKIFYAQKVKKNRRFLSKSAVLVESYTDLDVDTKQFDKL